VKDLGDYAQLLGRCIKSDPVRWATSNVEEGMLEGKSKYSDLAGVGVHASELERTVWASFRVSLNCRGRPCSANSILQLLYVCPAGDASKFLEAFARRIMGCTVCGPRSIKDVG